MKNKALIGKILVFLIPLVIVGILLFKNLGDRAMWDDEAHSAVLGRQIAAYGIPVFKGSETIPVAIPNFADYNQDKVFTWNTWLSYYLIAASFLAFGESEWAVRFPSVILALVSIALFICIGLRVFRENRRVVYISLLLLILSVPFLLLLRQSRYYAITLLGTLWMVWGYISVMEGRKRGGIHIAAGALLCFYAFYVIPFLNLGGIFIHALLTERRKAVIWDFLRAAGLTVILALPGIIYLRLWVPRTDSPFSIQDAGSSLWIYLLWINGFILPFLLPVVVAFACKVRWKFLVLASYIVFLVGAAVEINAIQWTALAVLFLSLPLILMKADFMDKLSLGSDEQGAKRLVSLTVTLTLFYILVLSLVSRYPYTRYLVTLIPLMLLSGAVLFHSLLKKNLVAALAFLLVALTTNFAGALPLKLSEMAFSSQGERAEYTIMPREVWRWSGIRSELAGFLHEITHSIKDPEKAIASFFKENGKPGQGIKASYGGLSLTFYCPQMRIISGWDTIETPDYIIFRGPYSFPAEPIQGEANPDARYKPVTLDTPNTVWTNSPDPLFHKYSNQEAKDGLKIFRRVE